MLTVQIVNDGDRDDSNVFLLLTGQPVTATGVVALSLPQPANRTATAGALSKLATAGSVTSPYTGRSLTIYQFTTTGISSGRLLVSFDSAIEYTNNAAPTPTGESMRWDKIEFGYPASGADLTAIDFFAIPMRFDYLDDNGTALATMTFYTSTSSLLSAVAGLANDMTGAFQGTGTSWSPSSDTLATFLRLLGPQTLTAGGGSPAPYPSFASYLDALVSSGTSVTVSGIGGVGSPAPANNSVAYSYSGQVQSDGENGYIVTFTGTLTAVAPNTQNGPYGLYTNSSGVTTAAQLPADLPVTIALPAGSFDNAIYAATANSITVGQSSKSEAPDYLPPGLIDYASNSVYANLAGDFVAGLHFGYPGGAYGNSGAAWYSNPPTPYPFANARSGADGFFNPYAAVLYDLSDAYGFPFSDRGGRPSPYVPQPASATTLRITILPDLRLDAPTVTITPGTDSLALSWPQVVAPSGFTLTGYSIAVSPPFPADVVTVPPTATSYSLTNLAPGLAYSVSVAAVGTYGASTVSSYAPVQWTATTGAPVAPDGALTFLVTLNWGQPTPLPTGATFTLAGQAIVPSGPPIAVQGVSGTSLVPLTMKVGDQTYVGLYVIGLEGDASSYTIDASAFFLAGNTQALVAASNPPYSATAGQQLVVGTPFAPAPGKKVTAT